MQAYAVWDLPVRASHWAIVVLVLLQFLSGEFHLLPMAWHMRLGEVTLAVVVFRILWGFFGSESARFSSFLRPPARVLDYLPAMLRRTPDHEPGHNPLGGWSVLALLGILLFQSVTGLFSADDIDETGPLAGLISHRASDWVTDLHEGGKNVLIALVVLHLGALSWHLFGKREDLVSSMVSGRRRLPRDPKLAFAGRARAAVLAAASAALVWGVLACFGDG